MRDRGSRHYQFSMAYDARGRRDRAHSYWMVTDDGATDAREVRYVTFEALGRADGRRAPAFPEFGSYVVPEDSIDRWIGDAGVPVTGDAASEEATAEPHPLPHNYLGFREAEGEWVPVSGYLPSEEDDSPEAAREAAELMEADAVVLEDGRHQVVAVRGWDGQPLADAESLAPRHA
jgi:hypothetical protein